ncbi:MAG: mechanosensitive ion channel family protein [Methanoregula sp.]|nr:mechanosensitive ion channel family protein [Methanoregula sp.]
MEIGIMELNYVYAAATVILGLFLALIARSVVKWLKAKAGETETNWDDIIIAAIGTPAQVTIIAVSVYIALKYFGIIPENLQWILDPRFVTSFYIILGAWIISAFLYDIIKIYGHEFAEKSEGDWDDRLVELLELVIRYVVWFAAFMLILSVFEVNITPFLAGAGIAGLAIALAAQDILSNFFGGALITVDKPFKVGDRIKVDNFYGDVTHIGPRSTRLQTLEYQIVTIPNNKITTSVIVNYSMPDPKIKMTIPVSVAYGSDIDGVTKILFDVVNDAIKDTEYLLSDPEPQILFVEFGASELKFIIRIWSKAYNTPDEVKDCLNRRINTRFNEEGIEIPFQQIDIHMRK